MKFLWLASVLSLAIANASAQSPEPAAQLVSETLRNEISTRLAGEHFVFTSVERSTRTDHHLWEEKVVETEQGILRRLIAVDGQPLSKEKQKSEDERIAWLIGHPDKARQENFDRTPDEKNGQRILHALTTAFTFTYEGEIQGCKVVHFTGNPAFKPSSSQEHILPLLEGTAYVNESHKRFCRIDATLSKRVEIGFGLLATLEKGGHVHIERVQTASDAWENSEIQLHVVGRTFIVRNASQDIDQKRTDIREIPAHLTLAQAAEFIKR